MSIVSGLFLLLSTTVARQRYRRIQDQREKWMNIKELEEDYDVYVADEYAYHIADTQNQKKNLKNLDFLGAIQKATHACQSHIVLGERK